jgi:biotin carboxyl carrier protein
MLLALFTLVAFILVPFLFWRGTWFGRPLTDAELEKYLHDDAKPRHIQHALSQISSRIDRRDPAVKRWYPRIADLGRHPVTELRVTAAWLMGQDNQSQAFHDAVRGMLADPEPMVRRNAALALARFSDPAGRAELRAMLESFVVRAPREGVLRFRLQVGEWVNQGTLVARIETGQGEPMEVRSPAPGRFERKMAVEGARVAANEELLALGPSPDHAYEALRALYLVGTAEDMPLVEKFTQPVRGWPDNVPQQAQLTLRQLRSR